MNQQENTLNEVNSRRRSFLAKLLAGGAAVTALPAMTSEVLAQGAADGKGKGGKGKGGQQGGGQGKGGQGKGGQGGRPDPATLAATLIKTHDKDGDGALNQKELEAALTEMMQRRGGGQGKGGGGGQGKGGQGKGGGGGQGKGKGKGGGGGGDQGGVRPARPEAE